MVDHPSAMARVGKYLMLDLLGEGAFGKVRLAVDETSGKEYAIKIMQKSHIKANELTLQVRREIAVMKAMRHPNIVNLHEVLTSSNNLYMVMDLVTGGELFHAVSEEGKIPDHLARSYFQQLVDAVHYCHSRRVYHRDLKPENLLLSADKHTLKITDFGLSSIKAQNASSELLHTIMGSPHYIAPEIITSAASGYDGAKVDVWASGVILFGMLAGYLPFDEPNTRALYKAIVQDPVKFPPHFSYDAVKLIKAMLQKDPHKRPTMEHVKTFAWFKHNYQPAVNTDHSAKTVDKSERKKLRHKLKKHGEKIVKKKKEKDDDSASHQRTTAFKHGRRKRETPELDTTDDSNFAQKSSVVVEVSSEGLEEETSYMEGINRESHDSSRHTKENVDPTNQTEDSAASRDIKSTGPARSFSDRSDPGRSTKAIENTRIFSRSSAHKALGRSSDGSRSKSGEDSGKGVEPGRSFTKLSNVARSFTKSRLRQSSSGGSQLEKKPSQSSLGRKESIPTIGKVDSLASNFDSSASGVDSSTSRVASFSSQPSTAQTDASHDTDGLLTVAGRSEAKISDFQSASESELNIVPRLGNRRSGKQTSAQVVSESPDSESLTNVLQGSGTGLSSARGKSTGKSSKPSFKESKTQSDSKEFEPDSLSQFISPISMASRSSFATITQNNKAPDISSKPRFSLPTNFQSPVSRQEIQTPRAVAPNLGDDLCVSSVQGFDEGMTPVNSLVNSAIFKPMKGLLESLVQQTPKTNRESLSPSVFCPEVEGDVEGTSEWCIDSLEVFADVEAPDKKDMVAENAAAGDGGKIAPTPVDSENLSTPKSPNELRRMDSSSFSIIDAAKPIFGPLSQELELKLTPSMEAEAAGTAAVRNLPPAQTKT